MVFRQGTIGKFALIGLVMISLLGCRTTRKSELDNVSGDPSLPMCLMDEGGVSIDGKYKAKFENRGGSGFMKVEGGGFSCKRNRAPGDPGSHPGCEVACPKESHGDPNWGWCKAEGYICNIPGGGGPSAQNPAQQTPGTPGGSNQSGPLSFSFYESSQFGSKCSTVPGADGGIAPAEGEVVTGIVCKDNWVVVNDPNNVQDVETGDLDLAKQRLKRNVSKKDFLDLGLQHCKDICVRMRNGKYEINLPGCKADGGTSDPCNGKIYKLTTETGKSAKVYIQSYCPKNHWKNRVKIDAMGDKAHCDTGNHIDIEKETLHGKSFLDNLTTSDQSSKKVRLSK